MASLEADLARREREESVSTDEDARLKTTATRARVFPTRRSSRPCAPSSNVASAWFSTKRRAPRRWADEIARLTLIFAEKDSELVASARRCALLASRLGSRRRRQSSRRGVRREANRGFQNRGDGGVGVRAGRAAPRAGGGPGPRTQIRRGTHRAQERVRRGRKSPFAGFARRARARAEAELAAKQASAAERDAAFSKTFANLSAEKAALAVKAKRAEDKVEKANAKVLVLEKKRLADAEVTRRARARGRARATAPSRGKSRRARRRTPRRSRRSAPRRARRARCATPRMRWRRPPPSRAARVAAAAALEPRSKKRRRREARTKALRFRVGASAPGDGSRIGEPAPRAGARGGARSRVETARAQRDGRLRRGGGGAPARATAREETASLRERSTELEREVAARDEALAARVEELRAAEAELAEVRGALERRGEALAAAERARAMTRRGGRRARG